MNKIFLVCLFFCLLAIVFIPAFSKAAGLVPCSGANCTITDFFTMIGNVYRFIVYDIATPLAILAFLAGGIMMMISAGNPGLTSKGKQVLTVAIIGLVLVFCSWLIVNVILLTLTGHGL